MDLRISKKDIRLLLSAGGILLLIVTYVFGYQRYMEEREVLEARQQELQTQVARLNEIRHGQEDYVRLIQEYDARMQEIFASYPADVREEDAILYACDMEDSFDVRISRIGINGTNQICSLEDSMPVESALASTDKTLGILDEASVELPFLSLFQTAVSYDFTAGYSDCKFVLSMILTCADRRGLSSVSLTYDDQTGLLNGSMNVNMYSMLGTGSDYSEPDAGVMLHGRDNLFGTAEP